MTTDDDLRVADDCGSPTSCGKYPEAQNEAGVGVVAIQGEVLAGTQTGSECLPRTAPGAAARSPFHKRFLDPPPFTWA